MTIQFNGWRAFWFSLFIAFAIAGLAVIQLKGSEFHSGLLIGFANVPLTIWLMFHDIRKRSAP